MIPVLSPNDPYFNNVSLLLSSRDGLIKDYSKNNLSISNNGVTVSSTQAKWGNKRFYFDGNSKYLTLQNSNAFLFDADHTIEGWIFWDGTYSNTGRVIYATGGSGSYDQFGIFTTHGITWCLQNTQIFPPINQWSHIAVSRQGTTVRFFLNGVLYYTGTYSSSVGSSTAIPYIGMRNDLNHSWLGNIDMFRITKGIARYTSNFTVPTQPFPAW